MGKASDYDGIPAEILNPDPPVWPVCERCLVPYVLRRCISLSKGYMWAWMRDCEKPRSTCKGANAVMHDKEGEVEQG